MSDESLHLGEPADEADWRALVELGLKGAPWERLVGKTADGSASHPARAAGDATDGARGHGGCLSTSSANRCV